MDIRVYSIIELRDGVARKSYKRFRVSNKYRVRQTLVMGTITRSRVDDIGSKGKR